MCRSRKLFRCYPKEEASENESSYHHFVLSTHWWTRVCQNCYHRVWTSIFNKNLLFKGKIVQQKLLFFSHFIHLFFFQLQILDVGGVSSGESFTLKYHDIDTIEDFLILRQNYDISLQRNWQPGDRFRSIIDDHWWEGQIVFRKPYKRSRPESQFICFVVQ